MYLLGCLKSESHSSHAHYHSTRDSKDEIILRGWGLLRVCVGEPGADGRCFEHLHLQVTDLLGKRQHVKAR